MTNEEYATIPALRASVVKHGATSMLHMRAAMQGELPAGTKALRWGRLFHAAVLEPAVMFKRVEIWEGARRYGKEWDAFLADCGGTDEWIVSREEQAELQRMSNCVHANQEAHRMIEGTEHELVFEWTDSLYGAGKMRCDGFSQRLGLLELKSTAAILPRKFANQCASLGYDMQLGWYAHGIEQNGMKCEKITLVAVESKPPYCVVVYDVPRELAEKGYEKASEIARAYLCCEATGHFPGVADERQTLELPEWAEEDKAVNMEGVE